MGLREVGSYWQHGKLDGEWTVYIIVDEPMFYGLTKSFHNNEFRR